MIKTYKYRIYPTKSQETKLENTFSICKALYNYGLEHRMNLYNQHKKVVNYFEQQNSLPEIKQLFPWYKSVYSTVLQDVLKRLDNSFQNFYRRMKDPKVKSSEKGYPKFKKKGQWNSITYGNGKDIKYPTNEIIVPKIGNIKIIFHRNIPIDGIIKKMSIVKEASKWFVTFSVELSCFYPELNVNPEKALGIDVGLIDFYYDSDGNSKKAPRLLRLAEKNLKRLQRKLSNYKKRTKEYYSVLKSLQKSFFRVKQKRLDFLYKTSYELFANHDLIIREDLQLKNLVKRPKPKIDEDGNFLPNNASSKAGLNKSFYDASFGKFFQILDQVASKLGKLVISVSPHYTSQDCSQCGNRVKKSLSTRTHNCIECGLVMNRDLNASINIKRLGIQSLGINSLEVYPIV